MSEAPQITAFRHLIDVQVKDFIDASCHFDEPLTAMAYKVKQAFELELSFIVTGLSCGCPDGNAFTSMIKPLSEAIKEIQDFRNCNRHVGEFFNHMSTVSESIVALMWISVKPAPAQLIRDMRDAGEYFGNRVLSENKGNQRHQTWINKWTEVLSGLENYVKEYHLTGFSWGAAAHAGFSSVPAGGLPPPPYPPPIGDVMAAGGLPPPPSPPPIGDVMAAGDSRHALLNELNQGIDIVRRLKPVKRDPSSQSQSGAAATTGSSPGRPQTERTYPPKFLLDGKKWRIEHQKDNFSLVIENGDMSQSLAMFKCHNIGLEVKNKMNGASIDQCKRSTIVLDDIISSVELIRCDNIKLQCSGHVPLISLDNCDSIQVFLTDKSIHTEVISSKSTSLNICHLAPDGDYTELAVPEQIKTVVVDRRLVSTVVQKI